MSIALIQATPKNMGAIWPHIEDQFVAVVKGTNGDVSFDVLFQKITHGELQLWAITNESRIYGFALTELMINPGGVKQMAVHACTGTERVVWQDVMVETLEKFARSEGCKRIVVWARKGWQRILKDYKFTHVKLEKELE